MIGNIAHGIGGCSGPTRAAGLARARPGVPWIVETRRGLESDILPDTETIEGLVIDVDRGLKLLQLPCVVIGC